ncbi:MAG: RnfABCDGE type electron transport complex subunit D, partial [Woeseiaceae bacterium]
AAMLFARAVWLGDPLTIPAHQLQNGALLIFAFFMISDPKTTPDSALGRVLFATLVAGVAYVIQFIYYVPNGAIFALIISAPFVPLIDARLRGQRYQWTPSTGRNHTTHSHRPVTGVYR